MSENARDRIVCGGEIMLEPHLKPIFFPMFANLGGNLQELDFDEYELIDENLNNESKNA